MEHISQVGKKIMVYVVSGRGRDALPEANSIAIFKYLKVRNLKD